jgi:large repetitive protein
MNYRSALLLVTTVFVLSFAPSDASTSEKNTKLPKSIFCEDLPAPTAGSCNVITGDTALLLKGTVLSVDTIFHGGEVLVDDSGLIQYVGCDANRPPGLASLASSATKVVCAKGVISPGLINAHDHLAFDHNAPFAPTTIRYNHRNDWRPSSGIIANSTQAKETWSELRQIVTGTTSIAGAGGVVGFMRNLDIHNFPAFDDLLWNVFASQQPKIITSDTFPLEHSQDFTENAADCSAYPRYPNFASAQPFSDAYVPHIAEGINAAAANEFDCLSSTDRNGIDIVDHKLAMIHGIALDAHDGRTLAERRASMVWSPRSNLSLYGNTAEVTMLENQGVLITIGTDWTPSGSSTIPRELTCVADLNSKYLDNTFTDRELWLMVTYNPAIALKVDDKIGSLKKGLFGDIAIYDGSGSENPYRAIINANATSTLLVLRRSSLPFPYLNGTLYIGSIAEFGDANILQSLPPTLHDIVAPSFGITGPLCQTLNVCGKTKIVCPLRETWWQGIAGLGSPLNMALLQAANANSYELFSCGKPTNEPTCTPSRPEEYDGTITKLDSDGDGIPDSEDNCKKIFNPVRPMDGGLQPDADGDGRGDACDKCPLDQGPYCTAIDPYTGEPVIITDGD